MPTSWKRADDNALRAHLQEALAQRAATSDVNDWSYSDYELAAMRAELNERQLARAALRIDAETSVLSGSQADVACESCAKPQEASDPDAVRLRMLIARCFKPSRRRAEHMLHGEPANDGDLAGHRQRADRDGPMRVFARLQRLR